MLNYYISMIRRIDEATRNQLIAKSRKADNYKDKEGNRWTAKNKCSVANKVEDYNKLDMNTFWKQDVLKFNIKVKGETDTYNVGVEFNNILNRVQKKVKENDYELTIKCIYNSLFEALNSSDVKISCSCKDFQYRFKVWATKQGYNADDPETREAKITNPKDSLGAGCKHILCALNNASWLKKIASVINNYIAYCKDEMEYNYSRFIFPKVYGMAYDKAVQMTLDDYDSEGNIKDTLPSDEAILNLSNALGKNRGKIKPGSNKNPIPHKKNQK